MCKKSLLLTLVCVFASAAAPGQMIHIRIPLHSETTPVQKLNRDGVAEVERRKYEKAEALFFKAYLYDPADPFTLNNLGYVSELQGEVERAATYYKLAMEQGCEAVIDRSSDKKLKGHPMMDALGTIKNMPMRINRINTYAIQLISEGRAFEAEAVLQQLLQQDPNNPFTLNNLAVAEEATGNLEEAVKYYTAAADTHSKLPVVVTLKKSARGKPISSIAAKSAEEVRTKLASMDIRQVRANMYAVRGVSALSRNDLTGARKDFETAYEQDPDSAFALNNIGYLSEQDGELETAVSFYARARAADDANMPVGLSTSPSATGEKLATVASESHQDADRALTEQSRSVPASTEPLELYRRDGTTVDLSPFKPGAAKTNSAPPQTAEPSDNQ